MKCFTFWENIETIINSRQRELRIYSKHMSWHGETCGNKGGFPVIFSRLQWPIEPKFSQVCYFIYKLWYTKCGPWDNTVYRKCPMALKTMDTVGNCQRLVLTVGVSQHMHNITNLWKFELNRSSKLRDNNERKTPLSHKVVCFQMLDFETSNSKSEVLKSNSWKITSFLKTMLYILSTSPHFSLSRKVLC